LVQGPDPSPPPTLLVVARPVPRRARVADVHHPAARLRSAPGFGNGQSLFLPSGLPAPRAGGDAVRGSPAPDAGRRSLRRPSAPRPGVLPQAPTHVLAGDGGLPTLRRPRLGGPSGPERRGAAERTRCLRVGEAGRRPAGRLRRGPDAVP